jgi:hypothetical protein
MTPGFGDVKSSGMEAPDADGSRNHDEIVAPRAMAAERDRGDDWAKTSLRLLAIGSVLSGLITFAGGLGIMMVLNDLLDGRNSSLRGWSIIVIYASQAVAVLVGWIAFASSRHRLAAGLASWPIVVSALIPLGYLLLGGASGPR